MGRNLRGQLLKPKKLYNLQTVLLQLGIPVPDGREAWQQVWVVLAEEVTDEEDRVGGLLLVDFLGEYE